MGGGGGWGGCVTYRQGTYNPWKIIKTYYWILSWKVFEIFQTENLVMENSWLILSGWVPIALEKSLKFTSSIHGKLLNFMKSTWNVLELKKIMENSVQFGWVIYGKIILLWIRHRTKQKNTYYTTHHLMRKRRDYVYGIWLYKVFIKTLFRSKTIWKGKQ